MATSPTMSEAEVEKYVMDEMMKSFDAQKEGDVKAEKEKVIEVSAKVLKAGKGQELFSKVFGWKPTTMPDFPVTVFKDTDWDDHIKPFIPRLDDPELDGYVAQQEAVEQLVSSIEDNDRVVISGPTGSGKSSMVKYVAQKLRRPFIRVNMNGDIESSALFGTLVVEDGATIWKDGVVTEAIKYGGLLCVDEWEVMPPEITMNFQNPLERGGFLFLKEKPGNSQDKVVESHVQSRYVFCGNTTGQGDDTGAHAGTTVQNTATIDRFDKAIRLDYLGVEHEMGVISSKVPNLDTKLVRRMVQYASLVRTAYTQTDIGLTMSPRTLINWGRKIERYGSVKIALTYSFLNKMRDSDKKVCDEFYAKVFGNTK